MFYKKAVLKKLRNIHRKTRMLESLFKKSQVFRRLTLLKTQMFSREFWEICKNIYFEEHLGTAALLMLDLMLLVTIWLIICIGFLTLFFFSL